MILSSLMRMVMAAAAQTMHIVSVGGGDLRFQPETLQALPGDLIQFQFWPRNVRSNAIAQP